MATVSPYKRDSLPFIHRAWKTAVDNFPRYSGMGIKLSTANGDTPTNGDHPPRPLKRRRVDEASPETARAMPGRLLQATPDDVEKTLRIEVLSITRASPNPRSTNLHYGNGSPEKKDIPVIKARCRVLVCEWSPEICRVLHCDSQICNFKVFRDSDDVCRTARIYLPAPFQIPKEKLLIERLDGPGHNLGDQYLIRVEIESGGDPQWPPMDLLSKGQGDELGSGEPRRWILSSQIIYGFEKGRAFSDVKIRNGRDDLPLGLTMDMDLRWSSYAAPVSARLGDSAPTPPLDIKTNLTNGILEPLTNGHINGKAEAVPNDHQKADCERNGVAEEEEEHEEATTPSRSLRTREKQNYNLKLLSDKARGKERKEKKRRKLATLERKGGSVTWAVPLIGEFTLDNYHCIRCFATHVCLEQLQEHLKFHTDIMYTIDPIHAYIRLFAPDEDALRPPNATFHSFSSIEDQESDVEGDVSPQKLPKRQLHQRHKSLQPHPVKPKDSRRLIPHIKQPLYDRLSKSRLEPGSLVDPPPVNDTWLVQKHRDIIRDYSDVHQDEKEYIFEWDAFVNRDSVTSEPQLQDVYLKFILEKSAWISASQNRVTEWAKHLSYLKSRNALTEDTIAEAVTIMRLSRSQKRPESDTTKTSPTKVSPPRPAYRKSVAGCPICGQPVRGPAFVICSNSDCSNALYHTECIRPEAKQSVESRNWRCNKCHDEQETT
ncbi:hypothetical protein F5Y08DRAFT_344044 [Xylaria arbuscula]|nr:hypothetical protein F5Y08DRAFT_344044 [Xylaria arbuscula]